MVSIPHQYIADFSLNGLRGRRLCMPSSGSNQPQSILLIYGIHSSLERMYSTAEFLSDFGSVTMIDLPGIGGMDSFYSIGLKPTLDTYADYLYSALKSLKLCQGVKVVAMSFGFLVVTRMLQKHPDAQAWFDDVISFVGFGRTSDFNDYKRKHRNYLPISTLFSTSLGGWLVKRVVFNPLSLRLMFGIFRTFNPKYKHGMATDPDGSLAMELELWQKNDARTRFELYKLIFDFDLTRGTTHPIKVRLHDMTTPSDQYFNPKKVSETLTLLYSKVSRSTANMLLHAPSIIGDKQAVGKVFSDEAKAILTA